MKTTLYAIAGSAALAVAIQGTLTSSARAQPAAPPASAPAAASAAPTAAPAPSPSQSVAAPAPFDELKKLRERLERLDRGRSAAKKGESAEQRFRLIQYGVSVGVSAAVYTPAPAGNTINGVAGGAMPFFGFFPAYWGQDKSKNLYCALEWSAPDAAAIASANALAKTDDAGEREAEQTGQVADEAKKSVALAEAAAAEEQEKRQMLLSDGAQPLEPRAEAMLQAAEKQTEGKAKEAKNALDAYEEALKKLEDKAKSKFDSKYVEERRDNQAELVDKLKDDLKGVIHGDDAAAVAVLAIADAALSNPTGRRDGRPASETPETCEAAVAKHAHLARISIESAPTGGGADPATRALTEDERKTAAELACELSKATARLVELKKQSFAFSGTSTNCLSRKFGFFVGYPAMFSATTTVDRRTAENRAERNVTPLISSGLVAAPNAIVAFTGGPWLGQVEVTDTQDEFIWGFMVGLAVTGDVLPALAD